MKASTANLINKPSPSRRGPRPQHKGTRTIAFWGTEDDLYAIKRLARLLNRRGRYSQSDVIRVALRRLCALASSKGTGWLKAEIDILKEEEGLAAKDGIEVSLPDNPWDSLGDGDTDVYLERGSVLPSHIYTEGEL